MNDYAKWREIYGHPSKRLKDQELILRFLAFYYLDVKYERPMNIFLNNFMEFHRQLSVKPPEVLRKVFNDTIDVVGSAIGPRAFRPVGTLNAAVFDSVMVAITKRIDAGPIRDLSTVKKQYQALLEDVGYQEAYTRSTADEERVSNRMKLAQSYISKAK
jgi:hypothetical protein